MEFNVAGEPANIGAVWAHLGSVSKARRESFTLKLTHAEALRVLDSYSTRQDAQLWKDHVLAQVDEFGTFIVDIYLTNLCELARVEISSCEWVIDSIDEVEEAMDEIRLLGKVVRFDPTIA